MKAKPLTQEELKNRLSKLSAQIYRIQSELVSFSQLFKSLDNSFIEEGGLFGLGMTFERLSKKLKKIYLQVDKMSDEVKNI